MSASSPITREVLLAFWKVHILHHAAQGPIYGQWVMDELRHHGYDISPGTLYPLLRRMERLGWLKQVVAKSSAAKPTNARCEYRLTAAGRKTLMQLRKLVQELHHEVVDEA